MDNAIIEIRELTFDYPGSRALDGIDVSIPAGSVTALVGPNGAGKTTLLRCIAALETPTTGTVRVMGRNVHESPRKVHRLMGYLSDHFGLYGDLTVAQGLEYAARSQGLSPTGVQKAIQTTAERMGLRDKLPILARKLSRGQRQRLAIGQAIIHAPRVLLLDEPASGLDPEARSDLAGIFRTLQAQGVSLLVSSHILAELDEYSTHMLALHQGRVLEHRALGHVTGHDQRHTSVERVLLIEWAENTPSAASWFGTQAHVRVIQANERSLEVGFTGTPTEQAALINACVTAGYPLVTIIPVVENLQQSYLKSLAAERAQGSHREP